MSQPVFKLDLKLNHIQPVGYANPSFVRRALACIVNFILRLLTGIACKMDVAEINKVPMQGPLILIGNHINFLEAPVLMSRVYPRRVTGFSKMETWHNPFKAILFNLWGGISIRRGEADLDAFRNAEKALAEGMIFAISPEGTRSGHGKLQVGHPGTVLLAVRSGAPIMPMGIFGSEYFWQNIKKLKRTDFHLRVGNPFKIDTHGKALSREVREQIVREMMYQMAVLLPPQNRGIYSDLENATEEYIHFEPGIESNLMQALDCGSRPLTA